MRPAQTALRKNATWRRYVRTTGGTSLIPSVQQTLQTYFSPEVVKIEKPFTAVVEGALQIAARAGQGTDGSPRDAAQELGAFPEHEDDGDEQDQLDDPTASRVADRSTGIVPGQTRQLTACAPARSRGCP